MARLPSKASLASMKDALSEATNRVSESVASFDIKDAAQSVKNSAVSAAGKTKETSITAYGFAGQQTSRRRNHVPSGSAEIDQPVGLHFETFGFLREFHR